MPLTAEDAVWWASTILKYSHGSTAYSASTLVGVKKFSAPDPNTLVITYSRPVPAALANLEQFYVVPKHIWDKYTGNNGKDLKTFSPEQHLPVVSGGPYEITKFPEKGTTVLQAQPVLLRAQSQVAAVALTYYTNPTTMIADLEQTRSTSSTPRPTRPPTR